MTILVMCVDQENGLMMALDADHPEMKAFGIDREQVIGKLVLMALEACTGDRQYINVGDIIDVDTRWPK